MAAKHSLAENQDFWSSVIKNTKLVEHLMNQEAQISVETEFHFELPIYGKVKVLAKPAVPLGTNFMSDVFITHGEVENGELYSSFVKVLPLNPSRLAAGFIGGAYLREAVIYQQWLPEIRKMRSLKNLDNKDVPLNVADTYFVNFILTPDGKNLEKETVCVLEELKSRGFRMSTLAKTAEGTDRSHAVAALRTYANYHALSIANLRKYKNKDGSFNLPSDYEIFRKDPNYIHPAGVYRTIVLPSYSKILRHFHQNETADWIDGIIPDLEKYWDWESFVDSGTLSCILHGDSWSNNLLFRYPSDESLVPEEMFLIDWQIARIGHPCHDLGYFLFSSTSSAFRQEHMGQLLDEYFNMLNTALTKLGIDLEKEGYTREKFLAETKERYVLMMMIALFILPILLDSSKAESHTLKDQDITNILKTTQDKSQAEKLDENNTKRGWESLFELETVASNPILSQRVIGLISDVKNMTL